MVLEWENKHSDSYRINYTCDNGLNNITTTRQTSKPIYNQNFRPYSLCRFCVTNQASLGSLWSEPTCNTTRFPEKLPDSPPFITCDYQTCPTQTVNSPNAITRTVTVQCNFPKNNTTNGLLTHLAIRYNFSSDIVYNTTNLTLCEMKLTGLSVKHDYYAQMSVCNSKGCSSYSDIVLISKALVHSNNDAENGNTNQQLYWLVFIVVPVVGFGICVLFVRRRRKKKAEQNEGSNLPNLEENNYDNVESSMENKATNYNELPNGYIDDNKI